MDDKKRFEILSGIMRASHFEWRKAALEMSPGIDPIRLVKKYWEVVGKDTAQFYLKKIDPQRDVAQQTAEMFVSSSQAMGEDAVMLGQNADGCWEARHNDCPWFHWHKKENLLDEDQVGCDQWLKTVVDEINAALHTHVRFETTESLPAGGGCCHRKFWIEK